MYVFDIFVLLSDLKVIFWFVEYVVVFFVIVVSELEVKCNDFEIGFFVW